MRKIQAWRRANNSSRLLAPANLVRRRARSLVSILLCLVVALLGTRGVGHAFALNAMPAPVNPAECMVAPRAAKDLIAVLKAPPGVMSAKMAGTVVATPPMPTGGEAADMATVAGVTATAREAVACLNANDLPRLFALYSDRYLYDVWGGSGGADISDAFIMAHLQAIASPAPQPTAEWVALVAVEDVRVLPDGRVIATVINSRGASRAVFVKEGNRWLVDWAYPPPATGTPTPP